MECLKGASKPNFMTAKLTQLSPSFSDDLLAVNGPSGEDFSVEDLLSFPTDPGFVEENNNSQVYTTNYNDKLTPFVSPVKTVYDGKMTVPETELCFPVTDVEDLEWVSQFVDETFSGDYSVTFPVQKFPEPETETVTLVDVNPAFKNSVHKRARSKRRRTGGSVWSLRSSSPLTDSSTSSSSTSSCTSKPLLVADEILGKPPVQMQIKKRPVQVPVRFGPGFSSGSGQPQPRRCSHCLVQKTPQWRTGPLGAKTLCNACGVRFKSGRLLPEYRPACSPTFSSEVHSNNHRKVLEMRRKKEAALADDGGLTHPVLGL